MCLAIPAKIIKFEDDDTAIVALEGIKKRISTALVEDLSVGDYVLVHVGYALHRVSPEEADRTLALMAEAGILRENLEEMSGGEA